MNIYYAPVENGEHLVYSASLVTSLEAVFGAMPILLGQNDIRVIEAMCCVDCIGHKKAYKEISESLVKYGRIEVFTKK